MKTRIDHNNIILISKNKTFNKIYIWSFISWSWYVLYLLILIFLIFFSKMIKNTKILKLQQNFRKIKETNEKETRNEKYGKIKYKTFWWILIWQEEEYQL